MKISNPELKVIRFGAEDVISTSGFFINSADFAQQSFSDPYVHFYGELGEYDGAAEGWRIYGESSWSGASDEYINGYVNDIRTASDATAHALGDSLYDAYSYNGNYYTKGASYYELYRNQ